MIDTLPSCLCDPKWFQVNEIETMGELHYVRDIRNKVVHEAYSPTYKEAAKAIGLTANALRLIETNSELLVNGISL